MKSTEKTHTELFEGLCKVLKENSQALSEGQVKAIEGFLDVLVESLNRRWGKAVKDFLVQQKLATENKKKAAECKKEETSSNNTDVLEAIKSLKEEILKKEEQANAAAQAELKEYKEKSLKATAEALKIEQTKTANALNKAEAAQSECEKLQAANEACQRKIAELTEQLRAEKLKNYLESKLSTLPTYEATLLRKRFSGAKSMEAIDREFDTALANVRERRNMASGDFVNGRSKPLNVEPNRLSETAKPGPSKVDLLQETTQARAAADEDYGEDDGFVDQPIPQEYMARWMGAVG